MSTQSFFAVMYDGWLSMIIVPKCCPRSTVRPLQLNGWFPYADLRHRLSGNEPRMTYLYSMDSCTIRGTFATDCGMASWTCEKNDCRCHDTVAPSREVRESIRVQVRGRDRADHGQAVPEHDRQFDRVVEPGRQSVAVVTWPRVASRSMRARICIAVSSGWRVR